MARINVEDYVWTDPRILRLAEAAGSLELAIGCYIVALRCAQQYYVATECGIPKRVFYSLRLASELIGNGLARRDGDFVRIVDDEKLFGWLRRCKISGGVGGKKSAANKTLRQNSKNRVSAKSLENQLKGFQGLVKGFQPSSSFSLEHSKECSNDSPSEDKSSSGESSNASLEDKSSRERSSPSSRRKYSTDAIKIFASKFRSKLGYSPRLGHPQKAALARIFENHREEFERLVDAFLSSRNEYYSKRCFDPLVLERDAFQILSSRQKEEKSLASKLENYV